ncbi:MAG: DUF58 domain-containing protein [bacterium]|nr:DUF58 domain-containing protein [bacterium]
MITADFLSQLDRFSLALSKRVTSKYAGARPSMFTGRGSTIKDHRMYAAGDNFKQIDWKIYARTDNLYIKRFEEERNMVLHVILDRSASMNYGKTTKFDYASMLGVGMVYLAMKSNEKFRFATFSDTLEMFRSQRGRGHVVGMVDYLNGVKPKGDSKFRDAMVHYKKSLGTRSILVIVSDFLFDISQIKEALYLLGHVDIKLVQVLDSTEKELKIEGDTKLKDMENNTTMKTYISQRLKSDYQKKLDEHTAEIEKSCLELGIEFYQVTTDMQIFDAFYKILK